MSGEAESNNSSDGGPGTTGVFSSTQNSPSSLISANNADLIIEPTADTTVTTQSAGEQHNSLGSASTDDANGEDGNRGGEYN